MQDIHVRCLAFASWVIAVCLPALYGSRVGIASSTAFPSVVFGSPMKGKPQEYLDGAGLACYLH